MSKQQKQKISLELPKQKNLVTSVFSRLKPKAKPSNHPTIATVPVEKKAEPHQQQPSTSSAKNDISEAVAAKLLSARLKAAEIMDSKIKKQEVRPQITVIKTVRPIRRPSPSSESSSSSSESSSSSSSPRRKIVKKRSGKKRARSSSSEERKIVKKHSRKEKKSHHKKVKELTKTLVKRAISPSYRRRESAESPPKKVKIRKEKVYRVESSRELVREVERDREIYEREKAKARERERLRSPVHRMSPSPKPVRRSRSPVSREIYRSTERSPYRRGERERKEAREYEIAKERERSEALARCQERQRERERIKKLEEMERARVAERRPRSVERTRRTRSRSYSRERIVRERETYERRPYEEPVVRTRSPQYRREEVPYERPPPRHYEERRPVEYERPQPRHYDERGGRPEYSDERRFESNWEKPSASTSKEMYTPKTYRESPKEWQKEPQQGVYNPEKRWEGNEGTPHQSPHPRGTTYRAPSYRTPRPNLRHDRPETPYRPRIPGYRGGIFRPRNPGGFNPRFSTSYFSPRPRNPTYIPRNQLQQQPIVTAITHSPVVLVPVKVPVEVKPEKVKDEDNLSEISDEAEDILTKSSEVIRGQLRRTMATEQKPQSVEETSPVDDKKSLANKTLKEEMQLDFEEISDGELDEENKIKSCGDALGVDWSSIVEESKKKLKPENDLTINTAKERWQGHAVLLDVGISTQMAGKEFAAQVIKECYDKLKQDITSKTTIQAFDGKNIKNDPDADVKPDIEAKIKELLPFTDEDLTQKTFAFAQVAFKKRLEQRRNLLVNTIGSCSRALSARQDLKMRRTLCGLPREELTREPVTAESVETPAEDGIPTKATSSIELAFQMFKKATGSVVC